MQGKYPVVTLCGSTRFKDAFMEALKRLALEGNIVISVGMFGHSGNQESGMAWMKALCRKQKRCWMICINERSI